MQNENTVIVVAKAGIDCQMNVIGNSFNRFTGMPASFIKGQLRCDPLRIAPWLVVVAGMIVAFFVFLSLGVFAQLISSCRMLQNSVIFHFARGFFATLGGMSVVFWVMKRKELELLGLRDHFSDQLALRTEELSQSNYKLSCEIKRRKEVEENLRHSIERLAHSNSALQHFAKIACHDLQEPLRTIKGYAGLLDRRYKDRFDEDGDQFLKAIVDGTKRMEELSQDILAHAKCQGRQNPFETVDCNKVLDESLGNLSVAINESSATINRDELPTVFGDKWQLVQLFQNLLSNAIKFRGPQSPVVYVTVKNVENNWVFSVRDNGIGIESQYQEQLFVMFKRLHGRKRYPGTGIGLAICKTIVENHHGKIWLESAPGLGSTFSFTIPIISKGD